jgi:hypothetical protein
MRKSRKKGAIMGVVVRKKDRIKTEILYARGVTSENLKFFKNEAVRLGYYSLGEYFNELARSLRKEIIDAGGDPVCYKGGQKAEGA